MGAKGNVVKAPCYWYNKRLLLQFNVFILMDELLHKAQQASSIFGPLSTHTDMLMIREKCVTFLDPGRPEDPNHPTTEGKSPHFTI